MPFYRYCWRCGYRLPNHKPLCFELMKGTIKHDKYIPFKTPQLAEYVNKIKARGFDIRIEHGVRARLAVVRSGKFEGCVIGLSTWHYGTEEFSPNKLFLTREP